MKDDKHSQTEMTRSVSKYDNQPTTAPIALRRRVPLADKEKYYHLLHHSEDTVTQKDFLPQ